MAKAVSGNIRFTIGGVSHDVDIAAIKPVIQFERHFDCSSEILSMAPRLEYVAYMAFVAAQNAGIDVPETFDDFLDVVQDLEVVDDQPRDANPTGGGQ